ncbi:hypothetical protein E0H22_04205 [Rhodopseudomonas boonkerdii]|jgi:hypothetical protein|nr:ABC transporter substrate-binding protein [Brucella anthropi]OYU86259.1 MAG: hypothetical protein CFE29_30180 [Bradyrhizobiaceae bacterium PARB1]UGV24948.1 hypothetical protein E0H22_04205 [Rhodopseudomonas boonkerdii]
MDAMSRGDALVVSGLVATPLPADIQTYTIYTIGTAASSKDIAATKDLIAYLSSPALKQAWAAQGFGTR